MPAIKLIPVFTADGRAHRLSIQRTWGDQRVNGSYLGSMGGIFPVVQLNRPRRAYQLCVAGTTYMGLKRSINHGSVVNTDFFVDVWLDMKVNQHFAFRIGTGHTSQHLSDDAIVSGYAFTNYARDYHQVTGVYSLGGDKFFLYGSIAFNYNFKTDTNDISNKFLFQLGFEHTALRIKRNHFLYYAGDIKLRQELHYASTVHIQAGYKFSYLTTANNMLYSVPGYNRTLRVAYNYNTGADERGQFYKQNISFSSIGLYFDF